MRIVKIVLGLILMLLYWYTFMPIFAWGFYGWPFMVLFFGVYFAIPWGEDDPMMIPGIGVAIIGFLFLTVIPFFATIPFRSAEFQELVGEIVETEYTNDISPTDLKSVVYIDPETADRLGDKKLVDEDRALGSQAQLNDFTRQAVTGRLYYVAPLQHSGFFKYNSNKKGTPGFMMVNATNTRDVKLVKQTLSGEDIWIQYQPNAYWGRDLERHIYNNGYRSKGFMDYSFEINDNLQPYWVVTLYNKTIGYSGADAYGILLVHPGTGEITEYSIADTPSWIDRIQVESMVTNQLDDWGQLIHGYFNWSGKDKIKPTSGVSLVYGDDLRCYYYTGMTSTGADNASLGFVLTDTRTKKTTYYKYSGATEQAARNSAQGKVQEKGYVASFPKVYNVTGILSYIMALKDQEGLIKQVAIVPVANYEIVGVGTNIEQALRSLKSAMNSTGNKLVIDEEFMGNELTGHVERINADNKTGDSYYYVKLREVDNAVFIITSNVSKDVVITQLTDEIEIKYTGDLEGYIDVDYFKNLELNLKISTEQIQQDKYFEGVKQNQKDNSDEKAIDNIIEDMSLEDKKKIIQKE